MAGARERNFENLEAEHMNGRNYEALHRAKKAIIIACSDPRFTTAFEEFILEELGLQKGEFVPINVAGGPAALAHTNEKFDDYMYLSGQIRFFLNHFKSIQKVIIIGHQDCGYYKTLNSKERDDLPKAAKTISCRVVDAAIEVECYYAKFADKNCDRIVFETIPRTAEIELQKAM